MSATFTSKFRDFRRGGRKFTVTEMVISNDDAYPGLAGPAGVQGYGFDPVANLGMDVGVDAIELQPEPGTYMDFQPDLINNRIVAIAPHASTGLGGGQLNSGATVLRNNRILVFAWGT